MLVGRDEEFARAVDRLEGSQPLVVTGEAGIGKTTLLRAAIAHLQRPVYEGGALSTLQWMPLLPLNRALGRELEGDPPFVAREVEQAVSQGVLFVDDVQWADRETRRVLPLLADRIAVAVAVRIGDVGADDALELLASAGFERLDLAPLRDDESVAVARRERPDLHEESAREIARRAGGNPLLLRELAATGEPSASLRAALLRRLRALGPEGRAAFARLALLGRPADPALVGDGAEELAATDLVLVDGATLTARHALLAEVVAEELDDGERLRLHAELAERLTAPGEAARHYLAAGDRRRALSSARKAAEAAPTAGERADHLRLAAAAADPEEEQTLRLEAAHALFEARELAAAEELLADLDAADPEERARIEAMRASAALEHGDSATAHAALDRGFTAVAGRGSPVEVRLRTTAAQVAMFCDHEMAVARTLAEEAVALARTRGADEAGALLVLGCSLSTGDDTDPARSLSCLEEAARNAEQGGDVVTELKARYNWFICGTAPLYDAEVALPLAEELIERAREHGLAVYERQSRALLGRIHFHNGDYVRAIATLEPLLEEALHPQARVITRTYLIPSLVDVGEFERARHHLDAFRADPLSRGANHVIIHWLAAELAFWSGRTRDALAAAKVALDPQASTLKTGFEPFASVVGGWAAVDIGAPTPDAIEFVTPEEPRVAVHAAELTATRKLAAGDAAAAAEVLAVVADRARIDRRAELRCRWGLGEAQRLAGDVRSALRTLEDVERRAAEVGMKPLLARIERSLRLCGARRTAPRAHDDRGLTTREREVLELVASGLSNPEIARRLGIGRPTVVRLIRSASQKLGARNRRHAAALAART